MSWAKPAVFLCTAPRQHQQARIPSGRVSLPSMFHRLRRAAMGRGGGCWQTRRERITTGRARRRQTGALGTSMGGCRSRRPFWGSTSGYSSTSVVLFCACTWYDGLWCSC